MSHATEISEGPSFVRRFARWWRNWNGRRRAMLDLDCCGSAEVERIARDVGVSGADLSVLAGKWPDAADLLYSRMHEINLDRIEITQADPDVMRDLQRVLYGVWKQTAMRARARKESVRPSLAKILSQRDDVLSLGHRTGC